MPKGERQSVHVRLPATLLAEIRERADDEGVSANALIATLLAGAIGFDLVKDGRGVTALATGRYATFRPSMGVPVQISLGRPKFPLDYELHEEIRELMPRGLLGKELSEEEFTRRYRDRLDLGALRAQFDAISKRHDGKRLVLLCFEDVKAGQFCHRRVFADWFHERTGQRVPEVGGGGTIQLGADNERVIPAGQFVVREPGR
jgi:hypothetical protein